jgi:hypothetical protein
MKVLIILATQYDLEMHQLDAKTTFLNGVLEENIYMTIPKGLSIPTNSQVPYANFSNPCMD